MTGQIAYYLNGMISWRDLSYKDQVWVFVNRRSACPVEATSKLMGE